MRVLWGMLARSACSRAGRTQGLQRGCAPEECVNGCVGGSALCAHVLTVCRPPPPPAARPAPLPPWPACVVGASGPRGREAAAGGCGRDGLDLFRLGGGKGVETRVCRKATRLGL